MINETVEFKKSVKVLEYKYRIDGMLGNGTFGNLYKANYREDGKTSCNQNPSVWRREKSEFRSIKSESWS